MWAAPGRGNCSLRAAFLAYGPCRSSSIPTGTFDRDGLYWYADHLGVHEKTSRIVGSLGAGAPDLYYVTMAPDMMPRLTELARAKSWVPPSAGLQALQPDALTFGTSAPAATGLPPTQISPAGQVARNYRAAGLAGIRPSCWRSAYSS